MASKSNGTLSAGELAASLDAFIQHLLSAKQRGVRTGENYRRDITAFLNWLSASTPVDAMIIREYAMHAHRGGQSPGSIRRQLSAIRSFFQFLVVTGKAASNPAKGVQAPKAVTETKQTLSVEQMADLLAFPGNSPIDKRDRAILELLYSCGLRLSELVATNIHDLAPDCRRLHIAGQNGGRSIPVGSRASVELARWLKARQSFSRQIKSDALFLSLDGDRLKPRTVQQRITQRAAQQSIPIKVHPQQIRRAFASHLLDASCDAAAVQDMLGSAPPKSAPPSPASDFEHLAQAYAKAHPRGRSRS